MAGGEVVRAFIAVELPAQVRETLSMLQRRLGSESDRSAKWVAPEGIHLTLHFFGDMSIGLVPAIADALGRAASRCRPIGLTLADAGSFPNADRPRVLWVGLGGETGALARLQGDVEAEVGRLGFRPEARAFSPHLTLARVRDTAGPAETTRLGLAIRRLQVPAAPFTADTLALIRSELRPSGAVYTVIAASRLGAGAAVRPGGGAAL